MGLFLPIYRAVLDAALSSIYRALLRVPVDGNDDCAERYTDCVCVYIYSLCVYTHSLCVYT